MILCVGAQERSFMNKWYRKTVTKVVLLVVAIISGAVCITSLLGALTLAGTSNPAEVWKLAGQPFEESADFNSMVQGMMRQVMERIRLERMFETDGSYSPDKLVDVVEYTKSGRISGENTSGVAYTLEELENWSEDYNSGEGDIYDTNSVIVCERTDGSYYYYYLSDFITLLDNGQLSLEMEDPDDTAEFLNGLENGELTSSGFYEFRILNSSGEIEYTDCWNFGQALKEKYAPDGAENLLQVAELKAMAHRAYVTEVDINRQEIRLELFSKARLEPIHTATSGSLPLSCCMGVFAISPASCAFCSAL